MNTVEQNIREQNMFGCTIAALKESVESSISFRFDGPSKVAMSMMSDAQEQIAMGMKEDARQTLNRAKFVLMEYVDWKAA